MVSPASIIAPILAVRTHPAHVRIRVADAVLVVLRGGQHHGRQGGVHPAEVDLPDAGDVLGAVHQLLGGEAVFEGDDEGILGGGGVDVFKFADALRKG